MACAHAHIIAAEASTNSSFQRYLPTFPTGPTRSHCTFGDRRRRRPQQLTSIPNLNCLIVPMSMRMPGIPALTSIIPPPLRSDVRPTLTSLASDTDCPWQMVATHVGCEHHETVKSTASPQRLPVPHSQPPSMYPYGGRVNRDPNGHMEHRYSSCQTHHTHQYTHLSKFTLSG